VARGRGSGRVLEEEGAVSQPEHCKCAGIMYRNNFDGTRDTKIGGKPSCKMCRGSGWVRECPTCGGAGVFDSEVCITCNGTGKKRCENGKG